MRSISDHVSRFANSPRVARFLKRRKRGIGRRADVRRRRTRANCEALEPRLVLDGALVISELMAANNSSLVDFQGDYSDWLEIRNKSDEPVGLDGWHLTDDPDELDRWTFPDVTIPAGGYLVVFASGKDLVDPGAQLHTDFRLSADGEYLALVEPDGVTIAHEYAPMFPEQLADISYGITDSVSVTQELVGSGTGLRALVPGDDSWGRAWTGSPADEPLDDSTWMSGDTSVGFENDERTFFNTRINFQPSDIPHPNDYDVDAGEVYGGRPNGLNYGWDQPVEVAERDVEIVDDTLVAWWTFDENSGSVAADSSPGGVSHPATLVGSDATFHPGQGRFGGAVQLAGVDEFIEAADHSDFEFDAEQSFSVSLWYRNDGAENTINGLITKGNDTRTSSPDVYWSAQVFTSSGLAQFDSKLSGAPGDRVFVRKEGENVGDGQWNHVVVVRDSEANEIRVYVNNGQPAVLSDIDVAGGDWAMGVNDAPLVIGNAFGRNTPGWFDDVGIWKNRVLNEDEIAAIHDGGIQALTVTDQRLDTLAEMQVDGDRVWELEMPDGVYLVDVSFGDASTENQVHNVRIEDVVVNDPDGPDSFDSYLETVEVRDGRLTIRPAEGAVDVKINYVEINPAPIFLYDDLFELDVADQLAGQGTSIYLRLPFDVADADEFTSLSLDMRYDDGFVAYLNGTEIARRNAPDQIAHDSAALDQRADAEAVEVETIDVTAGLPQLRTGGNVLAFHALTSTPDDTDFLLIPELRGIALLETQPQYYTTPTPGQLNVPGAIDLVDDTEFSVDRGLYDGPFEVAVTTDTVDAEIRYTLDGTRPTATTGLVYTGPISVTTTTTLRAAAFKPGYIASNVDTQTYIFPQHVLQQSGAGLTSVNWGHAGVDWAMDPDIVNHASPESRAMTDDLEAIPTVSLVLDWNRMFGAGGIYISGQGVEIATSFELFDKLGDDDVQIDGSVQIVGGSSTDRWKSDKLSMRVKFTEAFGPNDLEYPVFGAEGTGVYDTLVLDARLNNVWSYGGGSEPDGQRNRAQYTRDQFAADLQNELGGYAPHGKHVHVYINGVYWGMHTMHERPDDNFAAQYLGGDNEDYDVVKHNASNVVSGSNSTYRALLNAVNQDLRSAANYQAVVNMLDIDDFVNYMLVNYYIGNTDWAHHNWYASYNRVDPDGRWRFHSWDAEKGMHGVGDNVTGDDDAEGPTHVQQRLMLNEEYRTRFADLVQQHFFHGGTFTPGRMTELYRFRTDEIDQAIRAESARWGDNQRGNPYTRGVEWINERNRLNSQYFPQRTDIVLNQFRSRGWFPTVAAPGFSIDGDPQYGGQIAGGDSLSIQGAGGPVYFTVDGSDPRELGGTVSPAAQIYSGEFPLADTTRINARVRTPSGQWSALSQAWFFVNSPATDGTLAVTEINYNPYAPTPDELAVDPTWTRGDFEFVELRNVGDQTIDLVGVAMTRGVQWRIDGDRVIELEPGETALVVADRDAFETRYGTGADIAAVFASGSLDDAGERLTLVDRNELMIHDFSYDDDGSWPGRADGNGSSLEVLDVAGDYGDSGNWRSGSEYGGSPGYAGMGPIDGVVVNEVLTHTDPPLVDSIELYNPTAAPIDVGGWYLSDDNDNYRKFRIPDGTVIPSLGFLVFDENDFNPTPETPGPDDFSLDGAHGDDVWLMMADANDRLTAFVDHVEFGAAANGESWGRYPDGSGRLAPMETRTLNGPNGGYRIGPVVVSEVMYDATPTADDADLEFVEVVNLSDAAVDLTQWRIRGGIDFDFPAGMNLDAGEVIVLVPFDPADSDDAPLLDDFRQFYGLGPEVRIVGGYQGRLNNAGEDFRLQRPDEPPMDEPDFVPRLLEDQVDYDNESPWPTSADGQGSSLTRSLPASLGTEASSWIGLPPSPGRVSALPRVVDVVVNGAQQDPSDRPSGAQPSRWGTQRSDIRSLVVVFNMDVQATSSDVRLTGLGVNAPDDPDQEIDLTPEQVQVDRNRLTISFDFDQLPNGVYRLEVLPTVTGGGGESLDGDSDGQPGGVYVLTGDSTNRLHRMRGDFNGDGGVSIFDFATFAYWFGLPVPTAPGYVNLNGDDGISIFDFTLYADEFGKGVIYPVALTDLPSSTWIVEPAAKREGLSAEPIDEQTTSPAAGRAAALPLWSEHVSRRDPVSPSKSADDESSLADPHGLEELLDEIAAAVAREA